MKCLYLSKNIILSRPLYANTFTIYRNDYSSSSSTNLRNDDILHRSVLKTDIFQKSLLRLKVPDLEKTTDRYLASQKALLDDEGVSTTAKCIQDFKTGVGPQLQKQLESFAQANKQTSFINKPWTDVYLSDRRPVVLSHQPVLVFENSSKGKMYSNPVARATNMIISAARFRNSYVNNILEPEVYHLNPEKSDTARFRKFVRIMPKSIATYGAFMFKAFPLCMSQFTNLFNSTRIPQPTIDVLKNDVAGQHVVVIRNGHIYSFDVINSDGKIRPYEEILSNIEFIYKLPNPTTHKNNQPPGMGILTAINRTEAHKHRERLINLGNKRNFDKIDSALFVVCLDDTEHTVPEVILNEFMAGPSENRWFDKSFSLIFDRLGQAALTFEHSWGDGVAVLRLFNELFKDSETKPAVSYDISSPSKLPEPTVDRMEWMMDDPLKAELSRAREKYDTWRDSLEYHTKAINNFITKDTCKRAKLSPDAMMQLIIQMANDKVHASPNATYESCSTAIHKHGRTETLRSATSETRRFVETLRKGNASASELRELVNACSNKHNQLTKEAAMGQGWDRHLFALKLYAQKEYGTNMPAIFTDPGYLKANEIILSTSTLSSPAYAAGGFAAPHHDGYGVGYRISNDLCGMALTTWKTSKYSKGKQFITAFEDSVKELGQIIKS